MKVRCLANTGEGLLPLTVANTADTAQVEYPLKIGEVHIVYAQGILCNVLHYLIIGTYENLPSWYPAELFEVVNSQVHLEWYYQFYNGEILQALWGYHELIHVESHYEDLINREDQAIRAFLKRKKEIDEFS